MLLTSDKLPLNQTPLQDININNRPEGAPFIQKPDFSGCLTISHRANLAAAAYTQSPDSYIGIDLEKIEPRAWSFIEDFFTTNEAVHAKTLPKSEVDIWVTLAWSAKEAILKVWQKGLRLDTRRVEISPVPAHQLNPPHDSWQSLNWQSHQPGFPDCWLRWQRRGDYILTLAGSIKTGDSKQEPPELQQITFN